MSIGRIQNGEHIHLRPAIALANLVSDVKNNSASFINKNGWIRKEFRQIGLMICYKHFTPTAFAAAEI